MKYLLAITALLAPTLAIAGACNGGRTVPEDFVTSAPGIQNVVFIAKDLKSEECWHTSQTDILERHAPWSTFKIPHLLIALETRAVGSAHELLRWDPHKRPPESYWPHSWKQDQSLRTAFQYSAAWPFQDLVSKVGWANYSKWLGLFKFGNANTPEGRDDFWLGGPLAISPLEQVAFLSCVARTRCGTSEDSIRTLEEVALQAESDGYRMFAKTGSGPIKPRDFSGAFEGWYVGYIRDAQGVAAAAFATYVRSETFSALQTYRKDVTLHALSELGLWQR